MPPKFSTTIKQNYLAMKLADLETNGFFIEYKSHTKHWERIAKIQSQLQIVTQEGTTKTKGKIPTAQATFLCGQPSYHFLLTKIKTIPRAEVPDIYRGAVQTEQAWAITCTIDPENPQAYRPIPFITNRVSAPPPIQTALRQGTSENNMS